jgi:phosphoribosylamine--glycine ligase
MGAYSPSRLLNQSLEEKILNKIIKPTVKALKEMGSNYKGFLYAGLMIVKDEPYLIEYNVRMGDPECQTILPKLKTDLFKIVEACCNENLKNINIEWYDKKSLCVVMCSKGYPDSYKKNIEIKNLDNIQLNTNDYLFHAGTIKKGQKIFAVGGRVLNFVTTADNFSIAKKSIIKNLDKLNWFGGFYIKDIGYKVTK